MSALALGANGEFHLKHSTSASQANSLSAAAPLIWWVSRRIKSEERELCVVLWESVSFKYFFDKKIHLYI